MHILLFILYAIALGWILTRRTFFRDLRPGMLIAFFTLRVAAGCLHNWVAYNYYPNHGDIWLFFQDSFISRRELYAGFKVFWADNADLPTLSHNLIEWTHMLFNYLSFDNLYINTLFFSFLTLGGHIALFRVFYERFHQDALSASAVLLLPSVLFWTSCIHAEGIIYAILGWLFYTMHRSFRSGWTGSRIARSLLLTALAIFFRPAIAIGLLPALALWTAAENPKRLRMLLYLTTILLLISLLLWKPDLIPHTLSDRQQEYQSLVGNSRIPLPLLQPDWTSLWQVFPYALFNGLFQPLPGAGGQKVYFLFSLELLAVWIMAILAIVNLKRRTTNPQPPTAFSIVCLLLALLGMLLIGYIVPFVGAIVRYRSIYLPFLLAPCLAAFRPLRLYQKLNHALTVRIFKQTSTPGHIS